LAIRATVFGRFSFEAESPKEPFGMLALLGDDLKSFWMTLDAQEQLEARRRFLLHGDFPEVSEPWLKWLAFVEPRCYRRVLSFEADTDAVTDAAAIVWLDCDVCGKKCNGEKGLANHKSATHK